MTRLGSRFREWAKERLLSMRRLAYPLNTIWYLRAITPGQDYVSEGSAVAVRLAKLNGAGMRGFPKNYLLTCAHVIRQKGAEANEMGPSHADIRAWQPNHGFNTEKGAQLDLVATVRPIDEGPAETFYQRATTSAPNADWALLAFRDDAESNDQGLAVVASWPREGPPGNTTCVISGYPAGSRGFAGKGMDDIVRPSLESRIRVRESGLQGIVQFQKDADARPGMSGGGIFLNAAGQHVFVGLHRSARDAAIQLHAVSSLQIRTLLEGQGCAIVSAPAQPPLPKPRPALLAIAAAVIFALILHIFFPSPSHVRIAETGQATPEESSLGAVPRGQWAYLEDTYDAHVHYLVTEPFSKQLASPVFEVSSSQLGDRLDVRGAIEDPETLSLRGTIELAPESPAQAVRFRPSRPIEPGERIRLLVGIAPPRDDVSYKTYATLLSLERVK